MDLGNYRVIRKMTEGGFGTIYEAEHKIIKEKACLKQNKNASPDDAKLLLAEAKLLWNLEDHHSIPAVKDIYCIGKDDYVMVMSFIDGQTLEEIVEKNSKKNSRMHPEDVCWIIERLLGALYYCHCYGVIHTDVKPGNVFAEPKKHDIKLIDFGLAAFRPTRMSVPIGYTPRYAAPELINGQPPIPETDLYGAGMVMLFALGGDVEKRSFPSDTPEAIVEFCSSLLRYDPKERPNWEKNNPLEALSDIREKVFGRRHVM